MWHNLYLHEGSQQLVEAFIATPKHALLLSGEKGTGLGTLAHVLALELVEHPSDVMDVLPEEKGTITIERVRKLYVETRDLHTKRQVVIIDDMDNMSLDAQNAFLKLLEEPNEQVHFILTTHQPSALLETIVSRVQYVEVKKITDVDSQSLLRAHHVSNATSLQQMLFLAKGLPAELVRLTRDKTYFEEQGALVRLARDFLSGPLYNRLTIIAKLSDRTSALEFVDILARLVLFSGQKDSQQYSVDKAEAFENAMARIHANGHLKTQLMNLAFHV